MSNLKPIIEQKYILSHDELFSLLCECGRMYVHEDLKRYKKIPTAYWIKLKGAYYPFMCSNCNNCNDRETNYCPSCGSVMDKTKTKENL